MIQVVLQGFNGETVDVSMLSGLGPSDFPLWIERPTVPGPLPMNIGYFDEDDDLPAMPFGPGEEPVKIFVERYRHIGDGIYRRTR